MRTTITEERIREAIAVMAATGEKITLRSLRERVGGGSYDKLVAVLRKYEEEQAREKEAERKQEEARREPPPVIMGRAIELQRQLIRDLWAAAQELAEQQAAGLRDQVQVLTRENMELRQKVDDETAFWQQEVVQLESELQRALERAAQAASMEPLFFKAENKGSAEGPTEAKGCFNGAAFFQSGKSPSIKLPDSVNTLASMEPLFFKAENSPILPKIPPKAPWLQWSRFFSKRKIAHSQAPCFQRPAGCLASGREFIPTKPRSHQPCFCKFKPHKPFSPASSSRPTQHHLATRTDPTQHHCMTMDATQQR